MKTGIICTLAALLLCFSANAQETHISPPDGRIVLTVDNSSDLNYRISFDGETIVARSPLGFEFVGEEPMTGGFMLTEKPAAKIMSEEWTPVVKTSMPRFTKYGMRLHLSFRKTETSAEKWI